MLYYFCVFFPTAEPHNKLNIPTISNIPTFQDNTTYADEEGKVHVAAITVVSLSALPFFFAITILIIPIILLILLKVFRKRRAKSCSTVRMRRQDENLPAQDRIVPPCVKPTATLPHCTSQGIEYNDEWNDFTLKIPQGAIPEGESLTIDIGVALYGPFQYPEGLRPVSPVFWICVRDKKYFHFLKPVEVTLPHFLTLDGEEDVQSLGLAFLKGDHEMGWKQKTHFQQAEGTALFRPGSDCGVLHTHHFCYLCITSKISKETIRKAKFCIFATIPRVVADHKTIYAYFFVSFFLKTCLKTIRDQISEFPDESFKKDIQEFQFGMRLWKPALNIEIPQQQPTGWKLGLVGKTKVIT